MYPYGVYVGVQPLELKNMKLSFKFNPELIHSLLNLLMLSKLVGAFPACEDPKKRKFKFSPSLNCYSVLNCVITSSLHLAIAYVSWNQFEENTSSIGKLNTLIKIVSFSVAGILVKWTQLFRSKCFIQTANYIRRSDDQFKMQRVYYFLFILSSVVSIILCLVFLIQTIFGPTMSVRRMLVAGMVTFRDIDTIVTYTTLTLFFYLSMVYAAERVKKCTSDILEANVRKDRALKISENTLNVIRNELRTTEKFVLSLQTAMESQLLVISALILLQFVTIVVFVGGVPDEKSNVFYDVSFFAFDLCLFFAVFNSQHQYENQVFIPLN